VTATVSMIMPVWRPRADWLRDAVGSALAQRGCDLELIVVDDGSPEPVADLLAGFDDPRLRVLRVPHGGAYRARNAGTAAARGDFVRFVDGDDTFPEDSTARLVKLAGPAGDLIAYGATLFCDEQLRPVWTMRSSVQGSAVVASLLGRFSVRHTSLLFPRKVIDATGEWDPDFGACGDWDYLLRALEHAEVRGHRGVATRYRQHGSSITTNLAAGERGSRRVVERYFERHPEQRGGPLERLAEARVQAIAARAYATHGEPRKALAHLARSLRLDPRAVSDEVALSAAALGGHLRWALASAFPRPAAR
jgi:glycosyltransferase involved in cell wall biosynthesis